MIIPGCLWPDSLQFSVGYLDKENDEITWSKKKEKICPELKIELSPFIARHYDFLLDLVTCGNYARFIKKAVDDLEIKHGATLGYNKISKR